MLRHTVNIIAILTLAGCGTYHSVLLYEPSTATQRAIFVPGDSCSSPYYRLGTVSSSKKASVFLNTHIVNDKPVLSLSVTITGISKFRFRDNTVNVYGAKGATGDGTSVKMDDFEFTTGGGRFSKNSFLPSDELLGPPRASFQPYYPENSYENTQWTFSSKVTLPFSKPNVFTVHIPDASIDGETLSFPPVTFQARETNYQTLCLK